MRLGRFVAVVLVFAAVGAEIAGFSFAGQKSPGATRITTNVIVHMGEFYFQLSANAVPVGTVVFTLINDGSATHNFSIAGTTSPIIEPGATQTMTVLITQAGDYAYVCSLPGHAAFGMIGTLSLTRGKAGPPKPTATIKVSETEFKITLKTTAGKPVKSVKHGLIRFDVADVGKIAHNFVIGKHQMAVFPHGKFARLDVVLNKGTYRYVCSVAGHAAAGMKGTLIVT